MYHLAMYPGSYNHNFVRQSCVRPLLNSYHILYLSMCVMSSSRTFGTRVKNESSVEFLNCKVACVRRSVCH